MADISAEITAFKNAAYGEDVRNAMVSLANKLNTSVTNASSTVTTYETRLRNVEDDNETQGEELTSLNNVSTIFTKTFSSVSQKALSMFDIKNLLYGTNYANGYIANGVFYSHSSHKVSMVWVELGVEYKWRNIRFISTDTTTIYDSARGDASDTWVATYTGPLYITWISYASKFAKVDDFDQAQNIDQLPLFKETFLAQTDGESSVKALSQNSLHQALDVLSDRLYKESIHTSVRSSIATLVKCTNINSDLVNLIDTATKYRNSYPALNSTNNVISITDITNRTTYVIDIPENSRRIYTSKNTLDNYIFFAKMSGDDLVNIPYSNAEHPDRGVLIPETATKFIVCVANSVVSDTFVTNVLPIASLSSAIYQVDDKTKLITKSFNLLNTAYVFTGAYMTDGYIYSNPTYNVFICRLSQGVPYQIGFPTRFIDYNTRVVTSGGWGAGRVYTPDEDGYIAITTYNNLLNSSLIFAEMAHFDEAEYYNSLKPSDDFMEQILSDIPDYQLTGKLYPKGGKSISGDLGSSTILTIPKTNVKKNQVYSFTGKINSFDKILIGHGKNVYAGSWIELNNTDLVIHTYYQTDSPSTYQHGLNIADYLTIQIVVNTGLANITVWSNGTQYLLTNKNWDGCGNGDTFVESVNSIITDCTFTWSCSDFQKPIWMFGDSYFGMGAPNRWIKYLIDAGYGDNVLLNAYPGENSNAAVTSLSNMISNYGCPKYIIWCLGMNDGSDSNVDSPSTQWMSGINTILAICHNYDIIPILSTIPTVPNIYHEGKNKFVRESGHRYIDFADAVGAFGDGAWYSGMLSSDNVHPDTPGAKSLYYRAILDVPEITYRW